MSTDDIVAYTSEHIYTEAPVKIDWIDDTSANIVFGSPEAAHRALRRLASAIPEGADSQSILQLRHARPYSKDPEARLHVRIAVSTDQKRPRAYEASRFYMMHPELDPRERGRVSRNKDCSWNNRKRRHEMLEYTADMYDDDSGALARRSGGSTDDGEGASNHKGRNRDLKSRDRSASPGKDADENSNQQRRRRTPPPKYRQRDPYPFPKENRNKELFPSKSMSVLSGNTGANRSLLPQKGKKSFPAMNGVKELFPSKPATKELFPGRVASAAKKEFFPLKPGTSVHRRSGAFDAADETGERFGNSLSPTSPLGKGQLNSTSTDLGTGFSIRGTAKQEDQGFLIRGMASIDGASDGFVKELFPNRLPGNSGKELFAEKLQGRGGRRNKAIDMFY